MDLQSTYVAYEVIVYANADASSGTFIRESHSRIYSPEVFALSQLVSELPYSVLCGVLYWVLMVYPIGFGKGAAGLNGTGIQLLVILFMELFGVTLGQLIGALSPSIQVRLVGLRDSNFLMTCAGRCINQPLHHCGVHHLLRRHDPLPYDANLGEILVILP